MTKTKLSKEEICEIKNDIKKKKEAEEAYQEGYEKLCEEDQQNWDDKMNEADGVY